MKITSTQRQVLRNLLNNEPMWKGTTEVNPGGGIPAVRNGLIAKGLIDRRERLTPAGEALARSFKQ